MLIFEAKAEIDRRLENCKDLREACPEYFEALEIASACMQKQIELIDVLNDWDIETEAKRGDTYSAILCHDIVRQFCIYAEDDNNETEQDLGENGYQE